jgi:hypothetical protein
MGTICLATPKAIIVVTKHIVPKCRILGKAWEAQLIMLPTGKKCWVGSMKNGYSKFSPKRWQVFASGITTIGNGTSACNDPWAPGRDCSTAVGNGSWDNTHTFDLSNKGKRLGGKPNTFV